MGHAAMHLSHLRRLQEALEKIASDLDEIEGRSHAPRGSVKIPRVWSLETPPLDNRGQRR